MVLALAIYLVKRPRAQSIRVGADITTSGQFAYFGQKLQKGLQLAAEEAHGQTPAVEIMPSERATERSRDLIANAIHPDYKTSH